MVETIFNLAKVTQFLECLQLPFPSDSEYMTDSLAYIESITDATNNIEQSENKCVQSANYCFYKFSASSSLCSLKVSAESTA